MPLVVTIPAILILSLYVILILSFFAGWLRTRPYQPTGKAPATRVSILVPCRNEAGNIAELGDILRNQDYPPGLIEIIWIDDHSTDETHSLIREQCRNGNNIRMVQLSGEASGKKASLKCGMAVATGDLILLTDADSRPGNRWVLTMAKFFEDTGTDLILGPVMLSPANTAFDGIQKLEFLSLVASSIGAAGIGKPIMAQGPNIGVRATDYRTLVKDLDDRFLSGDDVFLLQAMKRLPGKKTGYVLNRDAIVRSKPSKSLSGFLRQRQRWASKAKGYRDPLMVFTTVLVFAANLGILALLVCALAGVVPYLFFGILFGIRILADLPLLLAGMRFFRSSGLMVWVIPVQILYPLYIAVAGVLSLVAPVRWEKR